MNLREFTESVDKLAMEMTKEELQMAFHSLARKVPEQRRAEVIMLLKEIKAQKSPEEEKDSFASKAGKRDAEEIEKEYTRLEGLFEKIQEGELFVFANGYEDYSSGYWDADWIYEYEDPQEIGKIFEDAASLILRSVNDRCYETAVKLFDLLSEAEVFAQDQGDCFTLNLEEMIQEQLASIDRDELAKHVLYAVYQSTEPEKRVECFYEYCMQPFFGKIQLEQILSLGSEELKGLPEFWDGWIELLLHKENDRAGEFLRQAVLYQQNEDEMIKTARRAVKKHPSLYLEVLEYLGDQNKCEQQLKVGTEALAAMDKSCRLRSKAALLTAEAALKSGDKKTAEMCWIEAFESHSTPVNYLRILSNIEEPALYKERALQLIAALPCEEKTDGCRNTWNQELQINSLSENDRELLLFLLGNFNASMKECLKTKEGLGWSGRFIKKGIPLFLLLLLQSGQLQQGCREMARQAAFYLNFKREDYVQGTAENKKDAAGTGIEENELTAFWSCFQNWKGVQALEMTEEQAEDYLDSLEKMIDRRVQAIVSGQHRSHYGSAAALAAAFGEVRASRGEQGAKEKLLLKYREEFPRHSAFHEELRSYGMPDMRKGRR